MREREWESSRFITLSLWANYLLSLCYLLVAILESYPPPHCTWQAIRPKKKKKQLKTLYSLLNWIRLLSSISLVKINGDGVYKLFMLNLGCVSHCVQNIICLKFD